MSAAARVAAQAKINIFLHVLAREASGYHGIETLFARIDLADQVMVRITDGKRTIDVSGADAGPAESNLAFRAAAAYAAATGWPRGFALELEKRIPVGGGLGGGSADAGAVLRALNALAPQPLAERTLFALAASLGSDVPFLSMNQPMALAWGRGERMLWLPPPPRAGVDLVCFPFGVSTAEAYGWLDAARETRRAAAHPTPRVAGPDQFASWAALRKLAANDFEEVVPRRHRPIADVIAAARKGGASIALLCGSGSTVFVIDGPRESTGEAAARGEPGGRLDAGASVGSLTLPEGARIVRTTTAGSVEEVELIG